MNTPAKRLLLLLLFAALLLLIPLIAMQFTNEVKWTLMDFAVAGILLFSFSLLTELVLRKIKNTQFRIILIISLLVILFLIWAELAVGIFGTPFSGN